MTNSVKCSRVRPTLQQLLVVGKMNGAGIPPEKIEREVGIHPAEADKQMRAYGIYDGYDYETFMSRLFQFHGQKYKGGQEGEQQVQEILDDWADKKVNQG